MKAAERVTLNLLRCYQSLEVVWTVLWAKHLARTMPPFVIHQRQYHGNPNSLNFISFSYLDVQVMPLETLDYALLKNLDQLTLRPPLYRPELTVNILYDELVLTGRCYV